MISVMIEPSVSHSVTAFLIYCSLEILWKKNSTNSAHCVLLEQDTDNSLLCLHEFFHLRRNQLVQSEIACCLTSTNSPISYDSWVSADAQLPSLQADFSQYLCIHKHSKINFATLTPQPFDKRPSTNWPIALLSYALGQDIQL